MENMKWKQIKNEGVFDNLPKGVLILFLSKCGRHISPMTFDSVCGEHDWHYYGTDHIEDEMDYKFGYYFIPKPLK